MTYNYFKEFQRMMNMINQMHHVSAITKDIQYNNHFFTKILGLRRVKKTVNQDDTSMYHLFYADKIGSIGTDMTFFEIKNSQPVRYGTNAITMTIFRVQSIEALQFFEDRFNSFNIRHEGISKYSGKDALKFYDVENQRMMLIVDPVEEDVVPFGNNGEIVEKYRITSIHGVEVTVQYQVAFTETLKLLGGIVDEDFKNQDDTVIKIGDDRIYVKENRSPMIEQQGYGSVHHFAVNVDSLSELKELENLLNDEHYVNSGIVDRHYFTSLYINIPGNIIVELAVHTNGFTVDEPIETLGKKLSLPPFLEENRDFIELYLKDIEV